MEDHNDDWHSQYKEDPPQDQDAHFALDSLIDYTLSLIMHRTCLEEALDAGFMPLHTRRIIISEWEDVTTDINEVPMIYQQFLFRKF